MCALLFRLEIPALILYKQYSASMYSTNEISNSLKISMWTLFADIASDESPCMYKLQILFCGPLCDDNGNHSSKQQYYCNPKQQTILHSSTYFK
jgi:hypothetical protein